MLVRVIRNSIKKHKHLLKLNKMSFVFKAFDYPQEFYKIYDIGLEDNYFKETTNKINEYLDNKQYDDAISEYNLFIHNLETYLDLNKTISLKILTEHIIRLATVYFDSKNLDGSITTIENLLKFINKYDLKNKEKALYSKLNEKIEDLLVTVYNYQIENLDFSSEEYSNLSELKFEQKYSLIAIKLIEMRENHNKNKFTDKPSVELSKLLLLKIINISPYTFDDTEFDIISNYCIVNADVINKNEINSNICLRLLKYKSNQTELNSLINELYNYYIKNKREKVNDYHTDLMLVLLTSINQYINSFPIDSKIIKIFNEVMTPKENETIFNQRNFKYYNTLKYKIILKLNEDKQGYVKFKETYNLINNV